MNGQSGIGTGYSSTTPSYNPCDQVEIQIHPTTQVFFWQFFSSYGKIRLNFQIFFFWKNRLNKFLSILWKNKIRQIFFLMNLSPPGVHRCQIIETNILWKIITDNFTGSLFQQNGVTHTIGKPCVFSISGINHRSGFIQ